jgi:hypothetical protein
VSGKRGLGRDRFSIKARSGVEGGVSSSNWIICLHTSDKCFVSSCGYYRIAAGKREGEREEGEREREEAPSAQEHTQANP